MYTILKGEKCMLTRPNKEEYPSYYEDYIKLVPSGEMVSILEENLSKTISLFQSMTEANGEFRYAPNKWTIKEVLGHMTDTERIMSARLLRFGRGDSTPIPGFNENIYVNGANFNERPLKSLLEEFMVTRNATIALIKYMPEEAWLRKGLANNYENTTRAIAYMIAGHEMHHCQIIRDRYLTAL
jgi:hypothetical protein